MPISSGWQTIVGDRESTGKPIQYEDKVLLVLTLIAIRSEELFFGLVKDE